MITVNSGFTKADSTNLPKFDYLILTQYLASQSKLVLAEVRSVKAQKSSHASYGDNAIGYVEVKWTHLKCEVRCRITPEHKVRSKAYNVSVVIVEKDPKQIECATCFGCVARHGICKHVIAVLFWLLRRSEEKSPTETQCYWRKSVLSSVGSSLKFVTLDNICPARRTNCRKEKILQVNNFLNDVIIRLKSENINCTMSRYYVEDAVSSLDMYKLMMSFKNNFTSDLRDFQDHCKRYMTVAACEEAISKTVDQSNSQMWHKLRYGRVTASKLHEAASCSTKGGTLVQIILGARCIQTTEAMKRGQTLESKVFEVVSRTLGIPLKQTGLHLNPDLPMFAASPDGLSPHHAIEIKCPLTEVTHKQYLNFNSAIGRKVYCQVQLQMLLSNRMKGLLCVASPTFEIDGAVKIVEIELDQAYLSEKISKARKFWEVNIYPELIKSSQ